MPAVPPARTLYLPTLRALGDLGGSGTIQEIVERVIENEGYDEETQALPHRTGGRTELEYRLAWARTHLRMAGLLENRARALRTSISKACKATAVPHFSPHDLRHRRISLLHLRGVPWARIGEFVGQRSLSVTADTYTHVLPDETELDYEQLLAA